MKIIIAGAGDVGFHLARLLADESQDIILIDTNSDVLSYAESHLDVFTLKGDSTSIKTLKEANAENADLLIAATSSENVNLITAIISKKLGVKKVIARISKTELLEENEMVSFSSLGIDSLFSPSQLASQEILRLLEEAALTDIFEFEGGKLNLIGITLSDHSPIINQTIEQTASLNPQLSFKPIAIKRGTETIIPRKTTKFKLNDTIYFISKKEGINTILQISHKEKRKIRNVLILGGSSVGIQTAQLLEKKYKVKLIEKNKAKCYQLSEQLNSALIICGDGSDVELLEEESLSDMDAFIALTGNSETNIMASLVAKNHNIPKTISMVENIDYINLSQSIGVDTLINKKLIAANNIFRHIRKGRVKAITSLHGVDAEVIEYEVNPGSKVTKCQIKNLNFPKKALIGGVVREEESYLPFGDFQIKPGDKVVVFSVPEVINQVENFFN